MTFRSEDWRPPAVAVAWLMGMAVASSPGGTNGPDPTPRASGPSAEAPSGIGLQAQVATLIERLGHDDYFVRQQAEKQLTALGFDAFDALSVATEHEDLEIAARARALLNRLGQAWASDDDPPEVRTFLDDYPWQDRLTKRRRHRSLAYLPDGAGIAALVRLVRFERSVVLSKYAALALIERFPAGEPWDEELADTVAKQVEGSRRAAVGWVRAWLAFRDNPQEALVGWAAVVDAEETPWRQTASSTSAALVSELIRRRIEWLNDLGVREQVPPAMDRLVALSSDEPDTLPSLVDWLLRQRAYAALEQLGTQADERFSAHPLLLYALAQAQAELGRPQQATQTSEKARKSLDAGRVPALALHLALAEQLRAHGLHGWAEKEYRHVLDLTPPGDGMREYTIAARSGLAEMLHDLGRDDQAAEVIGGLLGDLRQAGPFASGVLATMEARGHYFRASHFQKLGEHQRYRDALRDAVRSDAGDIDVLIACYHLPDEDANYRENIRNLIARKAAVLRQEIERDPDDPSARNQFAWLIGNTEGDFDEALRYSKQSLRIEPLSGGYYDTLAHVYFAKKDYGQAFRTQLMAVRLEPHSVLLNEKLEVFRKAWNDELAVQATE